MQDFIRDQNIKLYRKALAESSDEAQRRVLLVLIRALVMEEAAMSERPEQFTPDMPPAI